MTKVVSLVSTLVVALALAIPSSSVAQTAKKISANSHGTELATPASTGKTRTLWHPAPRPEYRGISMFRSAINTMRRVDAPVAGIMKAPGATFPDLLGSVTYSEDDAITPGLYTIGADASLALEIKGVKAINGGVALNGIYYYVGEYSIFGMRIITVYGCDLETGEQVFSFSGDECNCYIDMTADPTTGNIFALGIDETDTTIQLLKVSITENSISNTVIADLPGNWNALACDGSGQLYAINQIIEDNLVAGANLYKIDKLTGATTLVGNTGQYPYYGSSATIDPKSGKMYWTVCPINDEGLLCEVNTETGEATLLGKFAGNEQVQGLMVRLPLAEPDAPATATDLTANFSDGSFSGTVEFTAPVTTFDGTPAEGSVNYYYCPLKIEDGKNVWLEH